MKQNAFTLIELLVVIGIISVLAGLMFPVLARAKHGAKIAVSESNLHQCYLAASLYLGDEPWENLPADPIATNVFSNSPTCDPLDTWRASCTQTWGQPLVGSYAYGGQVYGTDVDSRTWMSALMDAHGSILIDAFASDDPPAKLHGLIAEPPAFVPLPTRVLKLHTDGSIQAVHYQNDNAGSMMGFSWGYVFEN